MRNRVLERTYCRTEALADGFEGELKEKEDSSNWMLSASRDMGFIHFVLRSVSNWKQYLH